MADEFLGILQLEGGTDLLLLEDGVDHLLLEGQLSLQPLLWNERYDMLLAKYPPGSEEHEFFSHLIETLNSLTKIAIANHDAEYNP